MGYSELSGTGNHHPQRDSQAPTQIMITSAPGPGRKKLVAAKANGSHGHAIQLDPSAESSKARTRAKLRPRPINRESGKNQVTPIVPRQVPAESQLESLAPTLRSSSAMSSLAAQAAHAPDEQHVSHATPSRHDIPASLSPLSSVPSSSPIQMHKKPAQLSQVESKTTSRDDDVLSHKDKWLMGPGIPHTRHDAGYHFSKTSNSNTAEPSTKVSDISRGNHSKQLASVYSANCAFPSSDVGYGSMASSSLKPISLRDRQAHMSFVCISTFSSKDGWRSCRQNKSNALIHIGSGHR
ncbi:hypothetical protein SERLADRAFT_400037 [Serpula lacrymans var. lacrymans S7.9]|uniref:Uncharacterized protein n=1 Tax=Serpula lacrymans var. lacrymans (strain S7.9) TaxID=578457 RepID=F8P8Q9_SERL9|nr:uncharacterized protein SERLADRAFT_400037 [Serpula lacrymans var. lacrymans S7.9]EGO20815.1 hypothetical protein SERLADRAFT_400037 [Serpula lacrymans var. lacrymans S7.9]